MELETLQKAFIATSSSYREVSESDTTMKAFYRGQKEILINLMLIEKSGTNGLTPEDLRPAQPDSAPKSGQA